MWALVSLLRELDVDASVWFRGGLAAVSLRLCWWDVRRGLEEECLVGRIKNTLTSGISVTSL